MRKFRLAWVQIAGAMAFAYPLVTGIRPPGGAQRSAEAPWLLAALVPILLLVSLTEAASGRLDSKAIALLGVLCGCAAMLRLPLSLAGANLFFILPILAGWTFGSTFGLLLGSLGMAASAVITGGVGPWLPFQMMAAGWVGGGSGLVRRVLTPLEALLPRWAGLIGLCFYGSFAAFLYGTAMNLYFWPAVTAGNPSLGFVPGGDLLDNMQRYAGFYILTSAGWDAVGALVNFMTIAIVGRPIVELFQRHRAKFGMGWIYSATPVAETSRRVLDPSPSVERHVQRSEDSPLSRR